MVYKPAQYGQVILPFTVLRRMECVMNGHRPELIDLATKTSNEAALAAKLRRDYGLHFCNNSSWTLKTLLGDPERTGSAIMATPTQSVISPK